MILYIGKIIFTNFITNEMCSRTPQTRLRSRHGPTVLAASRIGASIVLSLYVEENYAKECWGVVTNSVTKENQLKFKLGSHERHAYALKHAHTHTHCMVYS
jgi:hypothetical protein